MLSESDKTADHEMSTSDHGPFHCVRFASVRSVTTTLSGKSGAAIWHRSDRDRKGFDPTFCKTSGCDTAKVRAVSATNTEAFACVIKAFSLVFSCVRTKSRRRFCRLKRRFSYVSMKSPEVLVRFNYVASAIISAKHSVVCAA